MVAMAALLMATTTMALVVVDLEALFYL